MASNKVDLLNWLACIPSRICRIGLTVKQDLQVRIARHHTGYQRSIFVHNLIYRKNPAVEAALRQFMTIGDYLPCFFLFIYIGSAESQHQPVKFVDRTVSLRTSECLSFKYFLRSMTQRTNHMHRTMPALLI